MWKTAGHNPNFRYPAGRVITRKCDGDHQKIVIRVTRIAFETLGNRSANAHCERCARNGNGSIDDFRARMCSEVPIGSSAASENAVDLAICHTREVVCNVVFTQRGVEQLGSSLGS